MILSCFLLTTLSAFGGRAKNDSLAQLFDDLFNEETISFQPQSSKQNSRFCPKVNASETTTHYKITVEVPGIDFKDLKIEVEKNTLIISGEKKHHQEEKDEKVHRQESSYGQFTRLLALPEDADMNTIQARFERNILHITIQRIPPPPKKIIEIQTQ